MPNNHQRLLSVDIFRGLTVALMIIVNSPGNPFPYSCLHHAAWNGCTLADLVFPFFIFILGMSITLTFNTTLQQHKPLKPAFIQISKRALWIAAIGVLLNAFPHLLDWSTLRFFGVLQRIAICYFITACLFLTTKPITHGYIMTGLLIAYWLIMAYCPIPGYGPADLTPAGNMATYIDHLLIGTEHVYLKHHPDPEGIFSTVPAIATALIGVLTGRWVLSSNTPQKILSGLMIMGVIALLLGWFWGLWFPINKTLWTSSYVMVSGGIALLVFSVCYGCIEIKHLSKYTQPFEWFGTHAILVYVLHVGCLKIQALIQVPGHDGSSHNLRWVITEKLFGWASPMNASLGYAVLYMHLWLLCIYVVHCVEQKKEVPLHAHALDT